MNQRIRFTLNGQTAEVDTDPARSLLWVLRTDLGLTGTKFGCGEGHCGACTVLVNGQATESCSLPVGRAAGAEVTTIEGLAQGAQLHPVQLAFMEHDALQCGFCTPGMILRATALLRRDPDPTPEAIVAGLEGHLCRCGTHVRVIAAVRTAARALQGGAQ
ncbi:MAG: (2Fe-2S)-binding protein [Gemmatimonadetes bacterium]|nr:(2Fe-2S)-binding protein [Gemmatimonadota bacterium]